MPECKCPNCMGVGFFGLGSDCRDCGGTGERTFASLSEEQQKYLARSEKSD